MKKFFREFKEFIAKGNVIDMAVAVVIGGAFKEIVNALVNDIIMPVIGMMTGGASMSEWKYVISPEKLAADGTVLEAENALLYGDLIQKIVDFLIIALCIFVALKVVLALQAKTRELAHKKEEEAAAEAAAEAPAETEMDVLKDIRELLKANDQK